MGSIPLDRPVADNFLREIQRTVRENKLTDEYLIVQIKGEFTYMSQTFPSVSELKKLSKGASHNDFENFIIGALPFAVTFKENKTLRIYAERCRPPLSFVGKPLADLSDENLMETDTPMLRTIKDRFPLDPANRLGRLLLEDLCVGFSGPMRR